MLPGGNRRVECVVCKGEIRMGTDMLVDHDCGCYSHISCHSEDSDFECAKHVASASALANRPEMVERDEARDYIDHPLDHTKLNTLRTAAFKAISALSGSRRHVEDVDNPFYWLKQRTSLEWILRYKDGAGLQYMLSHGIQIDDFLNNGYTLDDLLIYKDFHKSPNRARNALYALGVTADHLREYKNALPMEKLAASDGLFQLRPRDIANMGVGFHPTDGLRSPKTADWEIDDMIYLGFRYKDLLRCGMKWRDQWDELNPNEQDMQALGATWEDIDALAIQEEDEQSDGRQETPEPSYESEEEDPREFVSQRAPRRVERRKARGSTSSRRDEVSDLLGAVMPDVVAATVNRAQRKRHVGFRKPRK